MAEKCTLASGAPSECEGLPNENLAAFEQGFRNLLMQLDPALYSRGPKATSVPTQKPDGLDTPGPAICASDLAFPTGNDILDHSPDAPFKMNMHELRNAQPPAGHKHIQGTGVHDVQDPEAYLKTIEDQRSQGRAVGTMAILGFGSGGDVYSFVMCDVETRVWLRAHPLFNTQLHTEPHASAFAFRLADLPGRGTGLVAARLIRQGECILREPPLLVSIRALTQQLVNAFQQATEHMAPRARKAIDALHDCHANDPPALRIAGAGPRLGIVRTNALGVGFPTTSADQSLGATFEIISRVNHSCAANLDFDWSYKDFQGSLWATRDIQPGEEMTMSYLSKDAMDASRKTRQAELLKKYKFKCACEKCDPL